MRGWRVRSRRGWRELGMRFDGPPSEWMSWRLGDLVEIFDGPHATPRKTHQGPIFLGIASLVDGRLELSDVARLSEADFARWTRRVTPQADDVVFSYETRLGQAALVPPELRCCLGRRMGLLRVRSTAVLPRYLLYAYLGPQFQRVIRDRTIHGSTVDRIPLKTMGSFPIVLPALDEQRHIVSVLGALDDKIDSNRRLTELVDETVATLFRQRFVDFVGVDEFENSEIGRIPPGWRTGSLTDLARFVNGKAFTKHANGGGRPILRIRELNDGVDQATPHSDFEAGDDFIARFDDILFAWSGSLGVYRWPSDESLINQHIFKVIPDGWPAWFVFAWIEEHMEVFRGIARDKATTMGHIQRRHLDEARLPLPTTEAIAQADAVVGPLDRHRAALVSESRTLTLVRDAVLPKLISGQIRVPDTADPAEVIEPAAEATAASS